MAAYAIGARLCIEEDIGPLGMQVEKRRNARPVATNSRRMLADFNITFQSTKSAFDSDRIITNREGPGREDDYEWRPVLA